MFAACALAVLCLMSSSDSAPVDCSDVVKPVSQLDPRLFEGRWIMVSETMKVIQGDKPFPPIDSITVDFYNSTFTQANRYGEQCLYMSHNISIEGPNFDFKVGQMFNFSGTFFKTSCSDCVVLSFAGESPDSKTVELCLFSRRREVGHKELEEFRAQVECLKMPKPVVMDPTKKLCPELSPGSS